ncbi:MAG: glucuronate isomerase [Salinibacter sp.]
MPKLNPDRFFDPDATVRKIARELYGSVKDMPIISPHGHVDPTLFSENRPFPNPAELFLIPDHYLFRMLYSQGISMEDMGVPTVDGSKVETDPRKIWQRFADHWYLFAGTPSGVWLSHELYEVFDVSCELNSENAQKIYDELQEKLNSPEFLPRNLFDSFNIEAISTTDAAEDDLQAHRKIRDSGWKGNLIRPLIRPHPEVEARERNGRLVCLGGDGGP